MDLGRKSLQDKGVMALYAASGFMLLICELEMATRLWGKPLGKTGLDGYLTPYLIPLLIPFPFTLAFAFRKRLKKWELSGDISAQASAELYSFVGMLLMLTYIVFMELA